MRSAALVVSYALALAACAPTAAIGPEGEQWSALDISATEISFGADGVGSLQYRGGLALAPRGDNSNHEFGGLSGLEILEENRLLAVSDFGDWLEARLVLSEAGDLVGVTDVRIAAMRDEGGAVFASKEAADAEGLAQLPDGRFAVSFEQTQTIRIYDLNRDGPFGAPRAGPALLGAAGLRPNSGLEAMVSTTDGTLLVGAEGGEEETTALWLARLDARDGAPEIARYPLEPGYSLTSLDRLPNGDFVALERFYAPVIGARARITRFSAEELESANGGIIEVEELAHLAPPRPMDNFEGLSVARAPDGGVRLYILSDDNFSDRQRTLLLAFDIAEARSD